MQQFWSRFTSLETHGGQSGQGSHTWGLLVLVVSWVLIVSYTKVPNQTSVILTHKELAGRMLREGVDIVAGNLDILLKAVPSN